MRQRAPRCGPPPASPPLPPSRWTRKRPPLHREGPAAAAHAAGLGMSRGGQRGSAHAYIQLAAPCAHRAEECLTLQRKKYSPKPRSASIMLLPPSSSSTLSVAASGERRRRLLGSGWFAVRSVKRRRARRTNSLHSTHGLRPPLLPLPSTDRCPPLRQGMEHHPQPAHTTACLQARKHARADVPLPHPPAPRPRTAPTSPPGCGTSSRGRT